MQLTFTDAVGKATTVLTPGCFFRVEFHADFDVFFDDPAPADSFPY